MLSAAKHPGQPIGECGLRRCFAAAQHDMPLMLFHGMTCLERSVLVGLIENLIEDDAGGD